MKILIADTYYPEALRAMPFDPSSVYDVELRKVLDQQFGTADFYSKNLIALGHECIDVITNHELLQGMWAAEHNAPSKTNMWSVLQAQVAKFAPDIVFLQDLSIDVEPRPGLRIAGQCSCPWPGDYAIMRCDVVFTSFPHYVERIKKLGVRAYYLPLAFEPSVLSGHVYDNVVDRDIDIAFVGGIGRSSHWNRGTETLEVIANAFGDQFRWYGYGYGEANEDLRASYCGPAWGRDMFEIYQRSKIVINRHGEVAEGYANNMRMFEATGCGALLLTESAINLNLFFEPNECVAYEAPEHAVDLIRYYLGNKIFSVGTDPAEIARAGQSRTLRDHTYARRMNVVDRVLQEMQCPA